MRRLLLLAVLVVGSSGFLGFLGVALAEEARGSISTSDYIASLERLQSLLAANQLELAKGEARALIGRDVAAPEGNYSTDEALLNAIVNASRVERPLQTRIATTVDELRRSADESIPPSDPKRLTQVAAEQEVPELAPGGEVPTELQREIPFMDRLVDAIVRVLEWVAKVVKKFLDWLSDFLPRRSVRGPAGDIRGSVLVMVGGIAVALLILGFLAIRHGRSGPAEIAESAEPLGSKRDENPLSRGASEWERYAGRLAAEGRHREAIRAWYHAVLVTCYSAGVLYFRKGRTNWEYLARLSPSLPWRPAMIALTRRFEVEWYGHEESSEEAYEECSERASRIVAAIRKETRDAA